MALQLVVDCINSTADAGKPTLLISHNLSTAFVTIDHTLLVKRLSYSFGVAGSVHSWIQSYLTDRTQSVRIGSHLSPLTSCPVGVPQGSVLGLLLFSIYMSPIFTIAESHQIHQQLYADNTQLYLALSPSSYTHDISTLQSCLDSLHIQFC